MEREVGGGIRMGNTCKPMAVSFPCMTKFTTNKKKKNFYFIFVLLHWTVSKVVSLVHNMAGISRVTSQRNEYSGAWRKWLKAF